MRDIIYTMSSKGLGMTSVVDARRPAGRHRHRRRPAPQDGRHAGHPGAHRRDVMTANPVTIAPDTLAVEALALLEQRKITVGGRHRRRPAGRGRRPPARPLADRDGVGRSISWTVDPYLPLISALVALLLGLAIGKAWERYKLRDGRWIDRRKARDSQHYVLGLNFLVVEPDRSGHRGAEPGRPRRRRRPRDPPDSRQRLPRARPGDARHPGAPGAAAAARS